MTLGGRVSLSSSKNSFEKKNIVATRNDRDHTADGNRSTWQLCVFPRGWSTRGGRSSIHRYFEELLNRVAKIAAWTLLQEKKLLLCCLRWALFVWGGLRVDHRYFMVTAARDFLVQSLLWESPAWFQLYWKKMSFLDITSQKRSSRNEKDGKSFAYSSEEKKSGRCALKLRET